MGRRAWILPVSAAALALAVAGEASATHSRACQSRGSTSVYRSRDGRFFSKVVRSRSVPSRTYRAYYSCSYRQGKKFRLIESGFEDEDRYGPYRIRPLYAAYAYYDSCGACTSAGALVMVQNMRTGKHVRIGRALDVPPDREVYEQVRDLELKNNASVAWIAEEALYPRQGGPPTRRVRVMAFDGHGERVLDEGGTIGLTSLGRSGSTLRWTHGGETRSATLY